MRRFYFFLFVFLLAPRLAGASGHFIQSANKLATELETDEPGGPHLGDWTDSDSRWSDDTRDSEHADTPYWYGWQTLLASLGSVGLGVGGLLAQQEWLLYPAIVCFFAVPATIHLLHGEYPEALASLLLRTVGVVGVAAAGLFVGALYDAEGSDGLEALTGLIYGGALGLVVVTIADAAFLSTKERERPPTWAVGGAYDGERAQLSLSVRF